MAEYVALWGRDIDDDSSPPPGNRSVRNGHHDPITEPIPVISGDSGDGYVDSAGYAVTDTYGLEAAPAEEPLAHVEQESRYDSDEGYDGYDGDANAEPEATEESQETSRSHSYAGPFIDRRPGSPGESLTFKFAATTPWYRTRRGLIVLIAVIAVVTVLALIPMLLRSPGPEAPTNVTPTTEPAPTSTPPSPGSGAPSLTSRPAPPPPAPPPPPPPPQETPVYRPLYPSSGGGSGSQAPKPEIGVTRAPISVAPKPVTPPTSAEVGRHGSTSRW